MYDEGVILSKPGQGRYIERENFGFAYEKIPAREAVRKIRETPVNRNVSKSQETLEEKVKSLEK